MPRTPPALDPIEQGRVDIGLRDAPAAPREVPPPPDRHTLQMKSFTGLDGKVYQRRADIKLKTWRAFQQDSVLDIDTERYWIAVFLGLVSTETIGMDKGDRVELGRAATDDMPAEAYYAIRDPLIDSITNPVGPKDPGPTGA